MDNKCKLTSTSTSTTSTPTTTTTVTERKPQQQQENKLQDFSSKNEEDFSQPSAPQTQSKKPPNAAQPRSQVPQPKVTVSLPKHAASRLRDLVQKRDIALLKLGIISVQFEGDQIIPLTINATTSNSIQPKQQSIVPTTHEPSVVVEEDDDDEETDCISNLNACTTQEPIIDEDENIESNIELDMYDNDNLLFTDYTLNFC